MTAPDRTPAIGGWKTIESAPRDGRWLLLEGEMSGGDTSSVRVGRWNPTYCDVTRCTYEWQCVDPYAMGDEDETVGAFWNWYADGRVNGWQPLPAPPTTEQTPASEDREALRERVAGILRDQIYLQHIGDESRVVGYEQATDAILAALPTPEGG